MTEKTILLRKELYKKVWTKSMVQLSKELGLSDRGLAKICEKYDIPRPGLGYWAKVEHGKKVNKKPLPNNPKLDKEKIVINPQAPWIVGQRSKKRSVYLREPIPITTDLSNKKNLHPMIAKAVKTGFQKSLERGLYNAHKTCFNITVGEKNAQRSLMLINTIIKALEKRGYKFKVITEDRELYYDQRYKLKHCHFEIKGEKISFSITEKMNQVEHKLTSDEKRRERQYGYTWAKKWDYVASGKIKFSISISHYDKLAWMDTEKKKLEDKVPLIIRGFLKAADSSKKQRIASKIREKKEAQERREAWEEECRRREEQKRIDELIAQANDWQKAKIIRRFLKAAERSVIRKHGGYDRDSDFGNWLSWGNNYVNSIDPLLDE